MTTRFVRMWEFHLAASEMLFCYGGLIVLQLQLARAWGSTGTSHRARPLELGSNAFLEQKGMFLRACLLALCLGVAGGADARDTRSDSEIKQLIIAESIDAYPGPCPCPYNVARDGNAPTSCPRRL